MSPRTWYGDCIHINLGAVAYQVPRPTSGYFVTSLTPDADNRSVQLSDARRHRLGIDLYAFYNLHATHTIKIVDDGGTTFASIGPLELAVVHLEEHSDADGKWVKA